jgi:uncharacterized protein YqgC (DUF456 family)
MDAVTIVLFIVAAISLIAGLAGLLVPLLPGPLLIYIGLFLAAWAEDFAYVGWVTLLILALVMVLAHAVDFLAGVLGAKRYGAGRGALIGAIIGTFIGLFFGIIGIIIGPFVGAVIGQLFEHDDLQSAGRVGFGTWLGLVLGMAVKIAFGLTMIGIFILVRFLF